MPAHASAGVQPHHAHTLICYHCSVHVASADPRSVESARRRNQEPATHLDCEGHGQGSHAEMEFASPALCARPSSAGAHDAASAHQVLHAAVRSQPDAKLTARILRDGKAQARCGKSVRELRGVRLPWVPSCATAAAHVGSALLVHQTSHRIEHIPAAHLVSLAHVSHGRPLSCLLLAWTPTVLPRVGLCLPPRPVYSWLSASPERRSRGTLLARRALRTRTRITMPRAGCPCPQGT
ncbi:hypothetical protein POSPLADRAFT_1074908 [Postia placenta MAD-698-R-SB12]|uniref:Uncharacterized protein n=1 Tax=Postia placenta MAD-698-R-SB12 TaxID=670580 RepID=A0A1X6MUN1_9APHY|nr:hypothetical protein POSPLADRAFT_1074908 [Postia placenta MAD-698-R-SB12]OSX60091.1 hypothetical protein POSPLADRAFT_1074908 [Postia placenta MAD-698-R-SB12]